MKPNDAGREEFFICVDTTFYTASDYTQVTNEYKEQYEREHPIPEEELTDAEALNIITGKSDE